MTTQSTRARRIQHNNNGKLITSAKWARQNEWAKVSESNSACPSCGHPYPSSCCRWLGNWCPGQMARASFLVDVWDKQGNNKSGTVLHPLLIAFLSALAEMHVVRNPTHLAPAYIIQLRNNNETITKQSQKLSTLNENGLLPITRSWLARPIRPKLVTQIFTPSALPSNVLVEERRIISNFDDVPDSGVTFRQAVVYGQLVKSVQIVRLAS